MIRHGHTIGALFLGCAVVIVGILIFSVVDRPIDTGRKLRAKVLQCQSRRRIADRWCVVQPENTPGQLVVFLPAGRVGEDVVLEISKRALSGQSYYTLAQQPG